jgi:hypothetical protein
MPGGSEELRMPHPSRRGEKDKPVEKEPDLALPTTLPGGMTGAGGSTEASGSEDLAREEAPGANAEGGEGAGTANGLMAAVNEGDEEVVGKMLGERRAEVDMIDSGGATPLMLACHQGNPQLGRSSWLVGQRGQCISW